MNIIVKGEDFYIKRSQLKKLQVDSDRWLVYYIDEVSNEKWVEEYPNAEFHGGGAPHLQCIDNFPWK